MWGGAWDSCAPPACGSHSASTCIQFTLPLCQTLNSSDFFSWVVAFLPQCQYLAGHINDAACRLCSLYTGWIRTGAQTELRSGLPGSPLIQLPHPQDISPEAIRVRLVCLTGRCPKALGVSTSSEKGLSPRVTHIALQGVPESGVLSYTSNSLSYWSLPTASQTEHMVLRLSLRQREHPCSCPLLQPSLDGSYPADLPWSACPPRRRLLDFHNVEHDLHVLSSTPCPGLRHTALLSL